jgi:hypothetical protein
MCRLAAAWSFRRLYPFAELLETLDFLTALEAIEGRSLAVELRRRTFIVTSGLYGADDTGFLHAAGKTADESHVALV